MNVISYDPYISQENIHKDEIKMVDLDTLLRIQISSLYMLH